jgi:hypothetical protein
MFTQGQFVYVASKYGWATVFNVCQVNAVTERGPVIGSTQFDQLGNAQGHKAFADNNAEWVPGQTVTQACNECAYEISIDTRMAAIRNL